MPIPLSRARHRFDSLRATRTLLVALGAFATMRGASAATFSNYQNAKLVIGQADFTTVNQSNTQTTTPGANDSALSSLGVLAVSQQGGRVFLYNTVPTTNGAPADVIVGKPDFTSYAQGTGDPQNPTPSADLLRNSSGVAFSPDGTKLLVADFTNNRVLIWNSIPTTNGVAADVVIGQTDFVSKAFGTSATLLSEPVGVMVTPSGKVLISDFGNRRVVVYNSIPTTNGAAADYVIGQTNLTSFTSSTAANGLQGPWHTALSPDGKLLIADATSNSVRIFNTFPTASNASADVIIGQTAFGYPAPTNPNPPPTPTDSTLNQPIGVSVSPTGQVAIGEFRNNRTLIYNSVPTTNGAAANVVLGQPDFVTRDYHDSTNGGATSQNGLSRTYGVNFIPDGRLLVSDIDNSRELVFGDTTPKITAATITPLAPKTNDIVTVHPTASDADGDTLTYSFQWKKNGNALLNETGPKLNLATPGNGDKGDAITCVVTITDSTNNTDTRTSDEVTVQNSAPVVTSATINHKHPLSYYTLTAGAKTTDADGDLLTLTYQWNKNGSPLAGETNSTLDLSTSGNGDDGDNISVTITAHDGSLTDPDSAPVTSDAVPVGNVQPQILYVRPSNATNKVGDKRLFSIQVEDDNEVNDIITTELLINTQLNVTNGADLIYSTSSGLLYLRQGDTVLSPIHVGAQAGPADILDNGAVRIVGSEVNVAVTRANTTLTIAIPALIRNGLVGQNTLFGQVSDGAGTHDPAALPADSGFVRFGPYTVTPQFAGKVNTLPTLSKLTPGATFTTLNAQGVAPAAQTFGFFAQDADGAGDIESMWFLAGPIRDWAHSATFVFYPRDRRLFLRSDDGNSFVGGGQIGTTGIIENSQVKVDLSKVKLLIYSDGKSLGLSLPLQAKTGLLGQNNVWLRVQDTKGSVAAGSDALGFVQSGTWSVKGLSGDAASAKASTPSS